MAPVLWKVRLLTRLATSQTCSIEIRIWRIRFPPSPLSRCSHSTLKKPSPPSHNRDPAEQRAAAGLIEGLLSDVHKETPRTTEKPESKEPSSDSVRAEFVAEVRTYERTSPTERWRHRHILSPGTRYDANDESRRQGRHSLGWSQEIDFKRHHRKLLEPPHLDKFRNTLKLDHVAESKMKSYVQVLTTPTADTPGTTLLLHFDNKRYLIGSLAEGTQRASVQMGARLLKVSECFVTGRTEWSNIGGMLGMILTLADSGASSQESSLEEALMKARAKAKRLGFLDDAAKLKELEDEAKKSIRNNALTVFGPPNLNHTLATARRFIFRKGMPVDAHEIQDNRTGKDNEDEWAPYWADDNIKVWAMSITPSAPVSTSSVNKPGPVNPRKRSIDEVYDEETAILNGDTSNELTPTERDQLTVKAVISEMFNSSWRLDTLYETPLSQVHMPASIFIRNPETSKVEKYHGPLPGGEQPLPDPDLTVLVRRPWPGALVESLPHTEPAPQAVSYIIRNHLQRGKFDRKRAQELNVEEGRKYSQLASGHSVINADGETITPDMVLGQSKRGGGIAVVDIPDTSYIENLISRPEWLEPKVMAGVGAVVWICGKAVAADSRVQGFIKQFSNLEHIVSSPDYCPNYIAMESSAAATIRLQRVDPVRYRVPVHNDSGDGQEGGDGSSATVTMHSGHPLSGSGVRLAARGQVVQLEPSFELQDKQIVPPISISAVENEISQDVLDEATAAYEAIQFSKGEESLWATSIPNKDAEIITLGTGSALPSKYRNVSATLLRVPGWGNILFDCGENTLGQLKRVFPSEELKRVLQELKIIFISHMHADHHLGTVGVIKAWYEEVHGGQPAPPESTDAQFQRMFEGQSRLAVISEPAMLHWLMEYTAIEDFGFSRLAPLLITPAEIAKRGPSKLGWFVSPMEFAGITPQARKEKHAQNTIPASLLGLQDVQAVAVKHCHGARAFSVTLPSGFKASYSGDCRPSQAFARIGKGSTVCIHEATFDDELRVDAEAKNHSTTSEALSVAQAMGAKACILTHFSQRYQKLPVLEHGNGNGDGEGKDVSQDLPMVDAVNDEVSANPEDAMDGPLEDAAATFPDQLTSNGAGQQYDLPSKRASKGRGSTDSGPAAVKLKLASDMKVAVAFDYMRVKVGEIGQMEKFTPALLKLFAEEDKSESLVAAPVGEGKKSKKDKKKSQQSA